MAPKSSNAPKPGRLEHNVDAVLLGRGLQLNASVERVLGKSRRSKFVPFKKGQRPPTRKTRRRVTRAARTTRPKRRMAVRKAPRVTRAARTARPKRRGAARKAPRAKPARGKQLRAARRKGPGK